MTRRHADDTHLLVRCCPTGDSEVRRSLFASTLEHEGGPVTALSNGAGSPAAGTRPPVEPAGASCEDEGGGLCTDPPDLLIMLRGDRLNYLTSSIPARAGLRGGTYELECWEVDWPETGA